MNIWDYLIKKNGLKLTKNFVASYRLRKKVGNEFNSYIRHVLFFNKIKVVLKFHPKFKKLSKQKRKGYMN